MPKADANAVRVQKTRAVKAESELKTVHELVQVISDQDDAITSKSNMLQGDVKNFQKRVGRGRISLVLFERRKRDWSGVFTYNMMVLRVAEAGLDHKLIPLGGLDDLVGQEAVLDAPLVVSSDLDKELSD